MALVLAFGLAGCSLGTSHLEVPLFFEYDPAPETGEAWTTFPLLLSGHKAKPLEDEERTYLLYPLFSAVREGREVDYSVLTVSVWSERVDRRGFEDFDVFLPPVLYGSSVDEGRYLTILPFGGTLKGKFLKDYWLMVTPLFHYMEERTTAGLFRSYHVPFPFVNWVSGGGRSGFRIWPLYAHYQRHDRDGRLAYDRTWILWPFWQTLRNNINTSAGEQWMWLLFPFYGRGGGPNHSQWTALWPLFHYIERTRHDSTGPYWELKAPFPFFIYGVGKNRYRLDFWPLFGTKERTVPLFTGGEDRFERYFVLGPLHRWERHTAPGLTDEKWWLMPLLWSYDRTDTTTGVRTRTFKVWPLFRYKEHRDGRTTVNLFSPLWFDDPEGAFEQIYNPLTRLYEHRSRDGEELTRLLWGLFSHEETPERDDLAVHPLFWDDERKDGSEHDVGVLFGLFRYIRRGEEKALRLFWLPEWPTWGGDDGDAAGDAGAGVGAEDAP